jgi:pimeloyl-ACP methyl ester carboxylesterase
MVTVFDHYQSDGIKVAYRLEEPEREGGAWREFPVLLIHGFASNGMTNWVNPSWTKTLVDEGYQTICIDNRGHGESEKLYDPQFYSAPLMARDAVRLLDHLGIEKAYVMGYSMGARITAFMVHQDPSRVEAAIFSGMGYNMVRGLGGSAPIAAAFEADSLADVSNDTARSFRVFAQSIGGDLKALAACLRGPRLKVTKEMLGQISLPTLIAVGTKDVIAGSPEKLAELIQGSRILSIPGRDHMKSVGDRVFKRGVIDFLEAL